ncbi:MAG: nitroreductase [Deltaproteobacteria bacterium]|nr:nitroreductase [Deltaproteobacteria bacterium]
MDVIEAIMARYSVRDFSSRPVEKETVMKILETATRSPSGGNGQPWEVFVASGASLERIRKVYQKRSQSGASDSPPGGLPPKPAYIQERMDIITRERLLLLGLDPDDPESKKIFTEWRSRLFGVPVLIVICMDKALSSHLDIGLFIQTICLAAQGHGIDSFIAGSLIFYPDVLRQELEIPDTLNIITGVGLGYPDQDSIINRYRSPRRPIQEVVRYKS